MISYNQRGYVGQSRSVRAARAEINGRLPMGRAIKELRALTGCSRPQAQEAFRTTHDGEWHHTGKFGQQTNYYCVATAERWLAAREQIAKLPPDWRERINAVLVGDLEQRLAASARVRADLEQETGCPAGLIANEYYADYSEEEAA